MVTVGGAHFFTPAGPSFELRLAHQTLHPFVVALVPLAAQLLGDPRTAVPAAFGLEHHLDLPGQFPVVRSRLVSEIKSPRQTAGVFMIWSLKLCVGAAQIIIYRDIVL